MQCGVYVPNFGEYGDPHNLLALALDAEEAGWNGFFIWDHLLLYRHSDIPFVDAWIALAAIAARTKRLRLGPMITPVARRRPWKLAREVVSLDHLSRGRAVLGVGLGTPPDAEFDASEKTRPIGCVRENSTKRCLFWTGYGAAKFSIIMADIFTSERSNSSRELSSLRMCQSGSRDSGPTSHRCAGRRAGTGCFP
jgi:Luciferase-like monooxygenase